MTLDPSLTLEALAAVSPKAARHLIRLGLDPGEDAALTLAQACAAQELDLQRTARELEAYPPEPPRDWMKASLSELTAYIVETHHAWTREELARLQKLTDRALAETGPVRPELIQLKVHLATLARDLTAHFQMEERNLFPAIRAIEKGDEPPLTLSTPSEQARTISAEHQVAEELFHTIRLLMGDYRVPEGATRLHRLICLGLRNLEDDLHLHLFRENHILFPRCLPR
ncbi:MAG TPA: hemerythrin domain-containing protein [Holophaga sp.]|nr:hemerythrin domain-containing protein [Holophaga sp.]